MSIIASLSGQLSAQAKESPAVDTGKALSSLISTHDQVAPGQSFYVALRSVLDEGWHTYWRNPGDSGEAIFLKWSLPSSIRDASGQDASGQDVSTDRASIEENAMQASEIFWPLPKPIKTGPFVNYGFEGAPIFPVEFTVPQSAKAGEDLRLNLEFFYLVCADICIPESGQLELSLKIGETVRDEKWTREIETALLAVPRKAGAKGAIGPLQQKPAQQDVKDSQINDSDHDSGNDLGGDIALSFTQLPEGDYSQSYFFPYAAGLIIPSAVQNVVQTDKGLSLVTQSDYQWEAFLNQANSADQPVTTSGVLSYQDEAGIYSGIEVTLDFKNVLDIGKDLPVSAIADAKSSLANLPVKSQAGLKIGFMAAIFGAFIGGLILNLMPCVFPIIALKALSLSQAAHDTQQKARRSAWAYMAGVLFSFMILALMLYGLRQMGSALGWGFQMQSPKMIAALALLFFVIGLNLSGYFEFSLGLENSGTSLSAKSGTAGAFFTGVLAVIVATPCTAPFMAGAIGYALVQPAFILFSVFLALGAGFAAPFLLLAYSPALLRRMPKPGAWMVTFKEFLAFPIFAAVIWLLWVLSQQASLNELCGVLLAALAIVLAIWLLKRGGRFMAKISAAALIIMALGGVFAAPNFAAPNFTGPDGAQRLAALSVDNGSLSDEFSPKQQLKSNASKSNIPKLTWSRSAVEQALNQDRIVFVDFTAAWCVSCKVNERLVLDKSLTQALFTDNNIAFFVADWTNKNDAIAAELARHGRAGVPLYLLFHPDRPNEPQILPQILSFDNLKAAIERS